jgi:GWxTD domain-containing protein
MSHRHSKLKLLAALAVLAGVTVPIGTFLQASPKKEEKLSRKERNRQKRAREESESAYKHWIDEEVPYIITDQERAAWKKLNTDSEREQFIEAFWERRNPNPQSGENEFKEEYYRRIAYANEHYASGIPGWRTDRGRIYIMYGPPDEIDSHPSGGNYNRPIEEGGGSTSTFPFETWRYRYIDGIGNNIELEFVDPSMSGEYHLTMDPGEKDALAHVPGAGLTLMEQMGMATRADRFNNTDGTTLGPTPGGRPASMDEFNRLDLYSKIWKAPSVKFDDLKAVVTSKLTANLLPFDVHTDFVRITDETVLTPITIQVANKDLQFQNKDGIMHAVLDIYGELYTISGRLASRFEDSVILDVPQDQFQKYETRKSIYQKALPLRPGPYKLSVVVKDDNSGHLGTLDLRVGVPKFQENQLSSSSLILADLLMPIPTNQVGTGPFVIGSTKVRPSVDQIFTRDQTLNIYMQVYNLGVDSQSHRPSLNVEYQISKDGKPLLDQPEDASKWAQPVQQITLEKQLSLKSLPPGKYSVQIKVTDNVRRQTISPTATFELR